MPEIISHSTICDWMKRVEQRKSKLKELLKEIDVGKELHRSTALVEIWTEIQCLMGKIRMATSLAHGVYDDHDILLKLQTDVQMPLDDGSSQQSKRPRLRQLPKNPNMSLLKVLRKKVADLGQEPDPQPTESEGKYLYYPVSLKDLDQSGYCSQFRYISAHRLRFSCISNVKNSQPVYYCYLPPMTTSFLDDESAVYTSEVESAVLYSLAQVGVCSRDVIINNPLAGIYKEVYNNGDGKKKNEPEKQLIDRVMQLAENQYVMVPVEGEEDTSKYHTGEVSWGTIFFFTYGEKLSVNVRIGLGVDLFTGNTNNYPQSGDGEY